MKNPEIRGAKAADKKKGPRAKRRPSYVRWARPPRCRWEQIDGTL